MQYMKRVLLIGLILLSYLTGTAAQKKTSDTYNFRKAQVLLNEDSPNWEEAFRCLTRQLEQTPDMADALLLRSYCYFRQSSYARALADLNRAIKEHDKKNDIFPLWMLYATRAAVYEKLEQMDNALRDYTMALKVIPKTAEDELQDILFDRAQVYYQQQKYTAADADYQSMLKNNPTELRAMIGRARNLLDTEKYDEALELLNQCESYDANYSEVYKFRMQVYDKTGQPTKAIDDALRYFELDDSPGDISFLCLQRPVYALAQITSKIKKSEQATPWRLLKTTIYEKQHQYLAAIEEYNAIAKETGITSQLLYYRGRAYEELGDTEKAVADFTRLMAYDGENNLVLCVRGDAYRHGGFYEQAIADYTKAIEEDPGRCYPYYVRGWCYELTGDDAKAMADYNMGIEVDSSYTYLFLMRGEQYLKAGKPELAHADFEQVLAQDTIVEDGSCRHYALHFLGRDDEAEQWMDRCIMADSLDAGNYYDKACLLGRMGRPGEAIDAIQRALELGYRRFAHMEHDDDLDYIRDSVRYKALVNEYEQRPLYPQIAATVSEQNASEDTVSYSEVRMIRQGGGTYEVPCEINGLPLKLILDTGASTVSLSSTEANFMLKNGYVDKADIVGKERYAIATGEIREGTVLRLRSVKLGDLRLINVEASVVHNQQAPLLLGQSVLEQFGKIVIDNEKSQLIIHRY